MESDYLDEKVAIKRASSVFRETPGHFHKLARTFLFHQSESKENNRQTAKHWD
jgi:hypothetical protein